MSCSVSFYHHFHPKRCIKRHKPFTKQKTFLLLNQYGFAWHYELLFCKALTYISTYICSMVCDWYWFSDTAPQGESPTVFARPFHTPLVFRTSFSHPTGFSHVLFTHPLFFARRFHTLPVFRTSFSHPTGFSHIPPPPLWILVCSPEALDNAWQPNRFGCQALSSASGEQTRIQSGGGGMCEKPVGCENDVRKTGRVWKRRAKNKGCVKRTCEKPVGCENDVRKTRGVWKGRAKTVGDSPCGAVSENQYQSQTIEHIYVLIYVKALQNKSS